MRVSVIVPVYNMASDGKLDFCLKSLADQTIDDYEIIAVDDCSSDDSLDIMRSYEKRYPGLFRAVHSEQNHHQGGAKNIGMSLAAGEWISFIDADDWVAHDYYERLLKLADDTGADMVGCDYQLTAEHSFKPGRTVHNNKMSQTGILDEDKYRSLILDSGSLAVKIYRREIVIDHPGRFPEDIFYEDNALSNSWMLRAKHFEYIPEPLYYYYQHEGSTVHTVDEKRCLDRMQSGRIMLEEARRYGYLERFRPEIECSFTQLFYVNTLLTYMQGVRPLRQSFVRELSREMAGAFPEFEKNRYYSERVNEEEKRLMHMAQRSTVRFMLYYRMLHAYRHVRYGQR
jgi:glycosyltransferase involved in cell wall biosynthesis